MSSARSALQPPQNPFDPFDSPSTSAKPPSVALIGAAAFAFASKQPGSQCFRIHLSDLSVSGKSTTISDEPPDLSHIPEEYHDFADVFSKTKADKLAPHHPYDLKIELEEGASPPIGHMYSLSQSELSTLCEFIDEHLHIGFICPTS